MKGNSLTLALAVAIFAVAPAFAQIPVTDGASIATNIANQVQTIAKWKLQYEQMLSQIKQMEQQYKSLTGARGLGAIFQKPELRDYLPDDWQNVYDNVRNGGYSGLTGSAQAIYDASKFFDACAFHSAVESPTELQLAAQKACEAKAVKGSQDKAFALEAFEDAKSRLDQINQLMGAINNTDDPKSIAELQGRIAAEQAMIQNEQIKLQMYAMVAAAEDRLHEQRQREINAKANARRGYVSPAAVDFGH